MHYFHIEKTTDSLFHKGTTLPMHSQLFMQYFHTGAAEAVIPQTNCWCTILIVELCTVGEESGLGSVSEGREQKYYSRKMSQ